MEPRVGTHPSPDTFQAFGLGKLDAAAAEAVIEHLADCAGCRDLVAASRDDFLDRLRAAHSPSSTPAPAQSLSGVARSIRDANPIPSPPAVPNLPPELANHSQFEVLRELGRGGMGVVYLARNRLMGRQEVLKVVNQHVLDRAGGKERFLREIQSAARLSHPNVVTAYSATQLGDLLVLAMEYVEGEDLAQFVKRIGPLPVPVACYYARQAALGLQHAFEKGMVHRDIKPQNLILFRDGRNHVVKVLDFGLAKVVTSQGAERELTGSGQVLGTPDYIAPEQSLDAARADIRADIYSLGCTLYYLLTGGPPFPGKGLFEVLLAHQSMQPQPLHQARPDVPEEFTAVVQKMLAKDPAQRYQTPAEVAQALVPFIKAETKTTMAGSARTASPGTAVTNAAAQDTVPTNAPPAPPVHRPQSARTLGRPPRRVAASVLVGLALVGFVGLWAAGVFKVKTKDGILVVQVNEPGAEVFVDGERVTVTWRDGGQTAEVRVKPGTRKVEVRKDGFTVAGEEVNVAAGARELLTARLEQLPKAPPVDARADVPPTAADPDRQAAAWALGLGGTVRVRVARQEKEVGPAGTLPVEPFELLAINLLSKPVGDAGLANLKGLTRLSRLLLWRAGVTDAGLTHLQGLASLQELGLYGNPGVTDAGMAHVEGLTKLTSLDLNATKVTDAGLARLKGLTRMSVVNLMNTPVTGSGFAHLEGLTNVEVLFLHGSRFDDAGVARLQGLKKLRHLGLEYTRVTDAGLVHLHGSRALQELVLHGTRVTAAGFAAVRQALPACRVRFGSLGGFGRARVDGDEVVLAPAAGQQLAYLTFGDAAWDDYDVTFEAKGPFHAYVRVTDSDNFWNLDCTPRGGTCACNLRIKAGGKFHPGATKAGVPLAKDGGWNTVRVSLRGPECRCFFNDQEVCQSSDPRNARGRVGVGAWQGEARFRNFAVRGVGGNELVRGFPEIVAPSPPAGAAGFVPLFNGKDLTGWQADGGSADVWRAGAGELVAVGAAADQDAYRSQSYLLTEKDYADFSLRFQFLPGDATAASGIALRAVGGETDRNSVPNAPRPTPFHLTVWIGTYKGQQVTGGLWWSPDIRAQAALLPDRLPELRPAGQWNDMEVKMRGQSLRVTVNGREVLNVMLNKTRPQSNPAPGLSRYAGRLGFLKRTGEVRFRNIEVKELR